MDFRRLKLDSNRQWDQDSQREFWNDWNMRHLQEDTLSREAIHRGEVVLSLIRSLRLQRPRILEIGCGNGWLADQLQMVGTVHGVDLSDASIEAARRRVPGAKFETGDFLEMKLPSGSFDVVVSLETLSHVPDQPRFVEVAARALNARGRLILTTQNRTVYLRKSNVVPPAKGQLRRWLTRRELRHLLNPRFKCSRLFTIEPSGDQGILRIVNSRKLNSVLLRFCRQEAIQKIKANLGFGQTIVVLAEKR
jgi:2-polyprenyl-3-methyl-5-hydroxy-6-metoxy-1,4-benzoquinol methylase